MTGLIVVWALMFAATMPIRQTYINGMIPSRQRATILSFDSLMSSAGGVWAQPVLGRAADVYGYAPSYLMSAGITVFALPCLLLSRRQNAPADTVEADGDHALARAAGLGDAKAFETLYRKHSRRVFAVVFRLAGGQTARAEDLVQEAFIRAWQALPAFRFESAFST